ncbi:MAG: radical SAM protein, partial [Desulfobacterales bacterium]
MRPIAKPFIVPVFLPHAGCPHRCVFCNQHAITGAATLPTLSEFDTAIDRFLGYAAGRPPEIQIAFYGGNFLGMDDAEVIALLALAQQFVRDGRADSIRFSTRPDTIDEHRLQLISGYPVRTVEIGAQSMSDEVLALTRRGHTTAHTV